MSSTEKPVVKKRTYKRKKRKVTAKASNAPKKVTAVPILKTVITIAPDGVITIAKTE